MKIKFIIRFYGKNAQNKECVIARINLIKSVNSSYSYDKAIHDVHEMASDFAFNEHRFSDDDSWLLSECVGYSVQEVINND